MRSTSFNTLNLRHLARESLTRAKAEIAAGDPIRLRYAALELRNAMEALTYDRALAFKDEIPPEEFKTWQPRKLMAALLDIDQSIGMTSTIAIGLETEYGKPPPRESMQFLGTDNVLTLADLKTHYDAIGSFLHIPSLENLQLGKLPDQEKLKARCELIVELIEKVLESRVWNSTLGVIAVLDQCMNEDCKKPVRKRMPAGADAVEAQCFECKVEYTVTSIDSGGTLWTPKSTSASCANPNCQEKIALWSHQLKSGTHWRCKACNTHNGIALSVGKIED